MSCMSHMRSLVLGMSFWLERLLINVVLSLILWPIKLIYRSPEPTWNAWFANEYLCQLDGRYC